MIEILVGMIGSGKSTYARARAGAGALIVSHDDLTAMLHGRYTYDPEKRDFYRRLEERIALTAIDHDADIVIDRTHLTRESRKRWIDFRNQFPAEGPYVPVVAVVFPVTYPLTHAHRRFNADPRGRSLTEWEVVAHHHYGQWQCERIDESEGFDAIQYREK